MVARDMTTRMNHSAASPTATSLRMARWRLAAGASSGASAPHRVRGIRKRTVGRHPRCVNETKVVALTRPSSVQKCAPLLVDLETNGSLVGVAAPRGRHLFEDTYPLVG